VDADLVKLEAAEAGLFSDQVTHGSRATNVWRVRRKILDVTVVVDVFLNFLYGIFYIKNERFEGSNQMKIIYGS